MGVVVTLKQPVYCQTNPKTGNKKYTHDVPNPLTLKDLTITNNYQIGVIHQ